MNPLIQAVFRVHGIGQSVEDENLSQELASQHGMDEKSVAAVKKLFPEQLKPFKKAASKARAFHLSRTFEGFGSARLLVTNEQETYARRMEELIEQINVEKAHFIAHYDAHIAKERELKGDAFRVDDYPLAEKLPDLFRVRFLFVPMPEPGEAVKNALFGKYAAEYEQALHNTTERIRREVFGMMMSLIAQTAESLTGDGPIVDSEGKKGPLAKLREFLDRVPQINITNDPQISALASECRSRLDASTEALRNSRTYRRQIGNAATDIAVRFGAIGARKLAA